MLARHLKVSQARFSHPAPSSSSSVCLGAHGSRHSSSTPSAPSKTAAEALAPQEALTLAKLTLSIISNDTRSARLLDQQLLAWQCPADELQQLLVVAAWQGKWGFCLQQLLDLPAAGAIPWQCYEELVLLILNVHSTFPDRMPSSSDVVETSLRSVWRKLEVAASVQLVQRLQQLSTHRCLRRDGKPFDWGVSRFARVCGPAGIEASAAGLVRDGADNQRLELGGRALPF